MGIDFATAALIDLDGSFFVQLFMFLLLWGILTPLVFKPYLKVQKSKEDLTTGRKNKAKEIEANAQDLVKKYQQSIKEARAKGQEELARLRNEGLKAKDDILQKEQKALHAQHERDMKEIKKQEIELEAQKKGIARELASVIQKNIMEVEK